MEKISYQYLIEEIGLTPRQIREIVHEAQNNSDGSFLASSSLLKSIRICIPLKLKS